MKQMNKNIILKLIKEYKKRSKYKKNIKSIGIFGSYARDEDTDFSDVDLFIELTTPKMFDFIGIKQDLEELTNRSVDIIMLLDKMNPFIKNKIEKEGIYVWQRAGKGSS